jgi:hypothetical protein
MYRYVDGGKRYLPGELAEAPDPDFFDEDGTILTYDERPAVDQQAAYPRRTSRTG